MSALKRVTTNIIVLLSVIFFPWWVSVLVVIGANITGYFFEGIVYGAIIDSMFGLVGSRTFMLLFMAFSVIVPIIKERVRLGS